MAGLELLQPEASAEALTGACHEGANASVAVYQYAHALHYHTQALSVMG